MDESRRSLRRGQHRIADRQIVRGFDELAKLGIALIPSQAGERSGQLDDGQASLCDPAVVRRNAKFREDEANAAGLAGIWGQ